MGKVVSIVLLGLLATALSAETEKQKETDNVADSSVTSYSTVVIHHPNSKNKKSLVKDGEEGRSQSYFKVKRLRASTIAPLTTGQQNGHNGGDFRPINTQNTEENRAQTNHNSNFRPSTPDFKSRHNEANNHKSAKSDFKPSQYLPESDINVSFSDSRDQSGEGARNTEYFHGKENNEPEYRRHKYKDEAGEKETTKWRNQYRHRPRHHSSDGGKVIQKTKQDESEFHREVFIQHDYHPKALKLSSPPPKQETFSSTDFSYDPSNVIPAVPVQVANPFQHFNGNNDKRLRPIPPPGMSDELIETLLSQQPQTFDSEPKPALLSDPKSPLLSEPKPPLLSEPRKKTKGQSFKVGYSIGFGNNGDDVVLGKPKDVRLHVNGRHSVWKNLENGVEMSQEIDKKKPIALKLEDNSFRASDNVLKNDVYYMQNFKPDTSVPTSGRTTFNHAQALTNSNNFDFSNAMEGPKWVKQPKSLQPQVDVSNIYQSLGYPPPLPVLLPGGPRGEGTMVHAIVIPLEQIAGLDYNWANIPHVPVVPVSAHPVAQALTLSPVVTATSLVQNHVQHQPPSHQPLHHNHLPANHKPASFSNHNEVRFKVRTPKHREFSPYKQQVGSFSSSPIVVAPAPTKRQSELQQELNNILAEEMMRKNKRMPAVGLRPPPAF